MYSGEKYVQETELAGLKQLNEACTLWDEHRCSSPWLTPSLSLIQSIKELKCEAGHYT